MEIRKLLILILGILLILYACKKEENAKEKIDEIKPFAIGNSWTYITKNNNSGNTDTTTEVISNFKKVEGNYGFTIWNGYNISRTITKSDDDGNTILVCVYGFNGDTLCPKSILYKRDILKGEEFIYNMPITSGPTFAERPIVKTCINNDTLISTPAGEFLCYVFEYSIDDTYKGYPLLTYKEYLSLNIGLIKSVKFVDGIPSYTRELLKYELK